MEWLLSQNVDPNVADNDGDTSLHYASTEAAVRFLCERAGVDRTKRNGSGRTALDEKRAELEELMADEDYEENDDDAVKLRSIISYLSNLDAIPQ